MLGWLFVPIIWLVSWLEGAPPRTSAQFCLVFLQIHYVIRIFANLIMDRDAEDARIENSRKHFGRPSFRCWVDKEGKLHVEGGEDPDHSTRCQRSLNEWYDTESRLKWNNWIYGGWILLFALILHVL